MVAEPHSDLPGLSWQVEAMMLMLNSISCTNHAVAAERGDH